MTVTQDLTASLRVDRAPEILADLVRLPSRNPVDGEAAVAAYVAGLLRGLGLDVETPEALPGRTNVIGRWRGTGGGPALAFNTHMDTVPEGEGWSRGPFDGATIEGRLYGRGSVDAKGPLAAFLAAVEALVRSDVRLRGDLVITAVVDEETCSTGARALVRDLRADLAVVGEPTELAVAIAHRGSFRPVIAVRGRTAHSSRPAEGVNAVYQALPVIDALRRYADGLTRGHPLCGRSSAAVTLLHAGVGENVIPDRCEITLDRRLVPGEDEESVRAEIEEVVAGARRSHPGLEAAIERSLATTGGPSELPEGHPLVGLALDAVEAAGGTRRVSGMSGACDMTHFRSAGIPCLVVGPGSSSQAHQPDEHMELDQLRRGALVYALIACAACEVVA
ncbi:MAG TPA: M20 family metallopeptidase [Candidatus Dormibacteraeota bacterium]|nr:M20 family metallopeptidase [Candidatus Dormibacteraeota bacterium]